MPGPVFAAPYRLDPSGIASGQDGYGRPDNPTRRELEAAIGELEGGSCLVFGSGQAAITALLLTVLHPGDTVVLPSDGYYQVRAFAATTLADLGIDVIEAPTAGPYPSFEGVRLVLLESPANPVLDVADIAAIAESAHAAGALVAVDNTTATPLHQRPLELGADIVVASGTKALTGHSDLILGYVCARELSLVDGARRWRNLTGGIPGAFDCWLARRSLSTLALRLRQQAANGSAIASLLRGHPLVSEVRWAEVAPGIVSFELPSAEHAAAFFGASRLVIPATSFGGLHTTADRRHQWGDSVPAGFLRLSCGIEDTSDLVEDIQAALDAANA
jgi:cystathionine gamma-lyase